MTAEERGAQWIAELDEVEGMDREALRAEIEKMAKEKTFLGVIASLALISHREGTMISVIIKGTRFEAAQAATNHRLPMAFAGETGCGETIGKIGDQFYDRVVRWYLEDIRAEPGKGFPVGSLLHYATKSD